MEVLIVHIDGSDRQNDKKNPDRLICIVKDVNDERKKAVIDYDELWEITVSKRGNKERKCCHIEHIAPQNTNFRTSCVFVS